MCGIQPDGTVIASAGLDSVVRVWWSQTGAELAALRGHSSGVLSVAFSSNGRWLASAGMDGSIRLWNTDVNTMNSGRPRYYDAQAPGSLRSQQPAFARHARTRTG
jgi:WD40 repeat protein